MPGVTRMSLSLITRRSWAAARDRISRLQTFAFAHGGSPVTKKRAGTCG